MIPEIFADGHYDKFRNQLLNLAIENAIRCPFCGDGFPQNCEYVDIGVGSQQCTPNVCEACGAYEQGAYELSEAQYDFLDGWCRPKEQLNTEAPEPDCSVSDSLDFFGDL